MHDVGELNGREEMSVTHEKTVANSNLRGKPHDNERRRDHLKPQEQRGMGYTKPGLPTE